MVPPRPGDFPRRKGSILIVGEVEHFFICNGAHAYGTFLLTDQMLDELRALILRSERLLKHPF